MQRMCRVAWAGVVLASIRSFHRRPDGSRKRREAQPSVLGQQSSEFRFKFLNLSYLVGGKMNDLFVFSAVRGGDGEPDSNRILAGLAIAKSDTFDPLAAGRELHQLRIQ